MIKALIVFLNLFIFGLYHGEYNINKAENEDSGVTVDINALLVKKAERQSNSSIYSENLDSVLILKTIVLPKIINETSGLEFYEDNFITHNDSGGEPSLYFFNESGNIVSISNINENSTIKVRNNDWEDITTDNEYIFIANTGNNFGYRKDLNIIRVNKKNKFMVDGIIRISYKDQEVYFPRFKHKYDAEALLIIDDKIALFSKDRESLNTDLFLVDKTSNGPQMLTSKFNYKVGSLITGGDYDKDINLLSLVGYNSSGEQHLILFENFELNTLENNTFKKFKIPLGQAQIEAVKIIDEKTFWVTSEDEGLGSPIMLKIEVK